jgi:hypothetical protein
MTDPLLWLKNPVSPNTGRFQLTSRYAHLTYLGFPPAADPNWVVDRLRISFQTHGYSLGEFSAAPILGLCYITNVVQPHTEVAVEILGRDDIQFQIGSYRMFTIEGLTPNTIRAVKLQSAWAFLFSTYHPRDAGPLVQSGVPKAWKTEEEEPKKVELPPCPRGGTQRTYCSVTDCPTCFERSFASHPRAAFAVGWNPREIPRNHNGEKQFQCDACLHVFEIRLFNISRGQWCPYCAGKKRCEDLDCQPCHMRSFASHPKACYAVGWNPRDFALNHHEEKQFRCDACLHVFEIRLYHISRGQWCPYCAGKKRCEDLECQPCHIRSFASHPKACCAIGWNPREFALNHAGEKQFRCDMCAHNFEARLYAVAAGAWCPYCAGRAKCKDLTCQPCYMRSFASHPKACCAVGWNPREFALFHTGKKWFRCDTCAHNFKAQLSNVALGMWCSVCVNKTQARVHELLKKSPYRVDFDMGNTPRPDGRTLRMDWLVHTPRGPVCIELDGVQHFREVKAWGGPAALACNQARDAYKMLYWLSRGARFIRLHQEDVFAGRFDWQTALMHAIDVSTKSVVCLEARDRDSWEDLRAEVTAWWDKPVETWLAQNATRMDASAEVADEEEEGEG